MSDVIMYYLRDGHHTEQHKQRISLSMKSHYKANPMTAEHKRKISEGMKKVWAYWKQCWAEQGLV